MEASQIEADAVVTGTLKELSDERLVLGVPGTDYQIHLEPTVPAKDITTPVGKRIRGVIEGAALRIFATSGGGRFIEPVYGAPRIVTGTVLAIDHGRGRALINVAVPMWVRWPEGQDLSILESGGLVTFYVESGTSFTPAT